MQVAKQNTPSTQPNVTVTGRHLAVTAAINDYATRRIENLHLDYPKIVTAHVILDVEKFRHRAEVVLNCSNHITIEASEECDDLYASIDGVVSKIARRMRKHKTRLLRSHRPRRYDRVHFVEEQVFPADAFAALDVQLENIFQGRPANGTVSAAYPPTETVNGVAMPRATTDESAAGGELATAAAAPEPSAKAAARPPVRTQPLALKPMFVDEAVLQLELTDGQQFLVFRNAGDGKVNVLYRRKAGDFGLIEPAEA